MLTASLLLTGCESGHHDNNQSKTHTKGVNVSNTKIKDYKQASSKLKIDNTKWKYDSKK